MLAGKGRSGIWVCGNSVMPRPVRFEKIGNYGENVKAGLASPQLNSYQREAISPQLQAAIAPRWPCPAEAWLATDGGFDAMNLIVQTLLSPGDRVVIEDPTATRLLDMLNNIGAEILPLPGDEQGPLPAVLATHLQKAPAMFIYQPRTHSATGYSVSQQRSEELAQVLSQSATLIVEDDGIGDLSRWPVWSLGRHYPQRTLHVHSFSKTYGPDLRPAVVSGTAELVKRLQSWRNFGVSWTSRILQDAVAWMLSDAPTQQRILQAKATYAARRQHLLAALARRGLVQEDRDGLSVMLPVASEQYAMITLAARGITVLPGERFSINSGQFIRVSIARLPADQLGCIADALVIACGRELNISPDL
ncbi:gntR family transcriptional regulator [Plautia stali symbiont]|nr:gntR family transcriptional regulator [Plautia stali symbiont]